SSSARQNLGTAAVRSLRALSTDTPPSGARRRVARLQLSHQRRYHVVEREDGDNARDHGLGRRLPYPPGAARRVEPLLAGDAAYDETEHDALHDEDTE